MISETADCMLNFPKKITLKTNVPVLVMDVRYVLH